MNPRNDPRVIVVMQPPPPAPVEYRGHREGRLALTALAGGVCGVFWLLMVGVTFAKSPTVGFWMMILTVAGAVAAAVAFRVRGRRTRSARRRRGTP